MENSQFEMIPAIHPHWIGYLGLAKDGDAVVHHAVGSRGTYTRRDGALTVAWRDYPPDVFLELSGLLVHQSFPAGNPDLARRVFDRVNAAPPGRETVDVGIPGTEYEVRLRLGGTDTIIFGQVFIRPEYESVHLPRSAGAIVDLGANIGLSTVFFGLKYPAARILAVEPDADNFALLAHNIAALGKRAQARHAAAWTRDGVIALHTENQSGAPLGAWGVQVSDAPTRSSKLTACNKMTTLLDAAGFARVDILKVDIEGAELELFSHGAEEWLEKIDLVIVETHDRFRPGGEAAVRRALAPLFDERPGVGENLFFRRKIVVRF